MPISLSCPCGRSYRVKDHLAGRKTRCSQCSRVLQVPQTDDADEEVVEAVEVEAADSSASERKALAPRRKESSRRSQLDHEPEAPPTSQTSEPAPRRKRPRRREREGPRVAFERGWFGSMNAGVVGGVLMMLIAIAWFVGGLAVGYIFFYPPILFVIGLIALIKGLAGGG